MRILFCIMLAVLAGCGEVKLASEEPGTKSLPDSTGTAGIDTVFYQIRLKPVKRYETWKKEIDAERKNWFTKYMVKKSGIETGEVLDSARYVMTENLLNKIIPAWYGTKWAFEGYTAVPNQGEVACGYFVSTTLKHAGFNVDRYKLAQKKPETEARSIQMSDNIEVLEGLSTAELKEHFIQNKKDGLYFAGLSNHVGYLLKRKGELFFIHSNYIGSQGVTLEKAVLSQALSYSQVYYLADITHNDALVKLWLEGGVLRVG